LICHTILQDEKTTDFAKMLMGKISGSAIMSGDGESKVTVALETLCIINIKPDSCHLEKR